MIQHIIYEQGGQIYINARSLVSTPTVSVYDGQGGCLASAQTAALETIDTTLSVAAAAEASSITVASATGFSAGKKFWISAREECVCKSVSSTTIALMRPLYYDHANGAAVDSYRVVYTVTSEQASRLFFNGYAKWYSGSNLYGQTALYCTKYPLFNIATIQDILDEDGAITRKLDPSDDIERLIERAWKDVLKEIGARARARLFAADGEVLNTAVAFAFMRNFYRPKQSPSEIVLYDRYERLLPNEIAKVVSQLPRDTDQDGVTNEDGEQMFFSTIKVIR